MTAPSLRYPENLAAESNDWVLFEFFKYESAFSSSSASTTPSTTDQGQEFLDSYNSVKTSDSSLSSIALYMPPELAAAYAGNWGGRDFSPLGATALGAAAPLLNGDPKAAGDAVKKRLDSMKGGLFPYMAAEGIKTAMNGIPGFGGNVQANDVLASTMGKILNPNTEVLYSGPNLRTFGLTFKMTARSSAESTAIKSIITTFKKAMLPTAGNGAQLMVNVPNIVQVTFMNKQNKNPWVTQFKQCAIGSVNVNYTPDGVWSTFRDGAPTAVTLQLQFLELKVLYSNEIDDTNGY